MSKFLLVFTWAFLVPLVSLSAQNVVDWRIREVYGDQLETITANDPERLTYLTELLEKRVSYLDVPREPGEKYEKLSAFPVADKYNPTLRRDEVFDPEHFNVLKYDLDFFPRSVKVYRVDGTDWVIVVRPLEIGGARK